MKVDIKNLTKFYDKVKAVDSLNININDGEFISILGPSGCGKSTLLYMLTGITEPSGGEIFFDDKKINDVSIEKRNIGLVFQDYSLYPHLTVKENLRFPLKMNKISKKESEERVNKISKILKIDNLLNRKPRELSGGQQQRVSIGRAIIKNPSLLLMDEPFSNLDTALRIEMREELKHIQKDFKITTLFVTHDQEEALSISDRIILMDKGQVVQYSTARDLYEYPNSIYAASFIGRPKINIISNNEIKYLDFSDIRNFKDYIAIGIRPEDVIISNKIVNKNCKVIGCSRKDSISEYSINIKSIKGIVEKLVLLGKDTYININIKGRELKVVMTGDCNFKDKQEIYINFNRIHMFKE